jgi:probable F420-dependent oxidoreductase
MEQGGVSNYPGNVSGSRPYSHQQEIIDVTVALAAAAVSTSQVEIGTAVLIAPYRNPLVVAHQLASIDVLSGGRLTVGVGAGWARGEFAALGVPYEHRGRITDECIEVYKSVWSSSPAAYAGKFFSFENIAVDPKPLQDPRPKLMYGGTTPAGARRAVRHCDGFFPTLKEPFGSPGKFDHLRESIVKEAERIDRELNGFELWASTAALVTDMQHPRARQVPRHTLTGTAEQVLEDLHRFAAHGYSKCVIFFEVPSASVAEQVDIMHRFAEEVLPYTEAIVPSAWP